MRCESLTINILRPNVTKMPIIINGSKSWKKAEEQGFEVYTAAEAAKKADIIMILICNFFGQ